MRLFSSGFEWNQFFATATYSMDGWAAGGSPTLQSSVVRTGDYALKCTATSIQYAATNDFTAGSGNQVYASFWFYVTKIPTSSSFNIVRLEYPGGGGVKWYVYVQLESTGKLTLNALYNNIGTTSGAVQINTWYNLQLSLKIAGASSVHEMRWNGETITDTTAEDSTRTVTHFYVGAVTANSNAEYIYIDDVVINDDQGTDEAGYPNTDEKVDVLFPVADVSIGGWTGGAGGTTNLYDALNNRPPTGTSGTETDLTNIKNVQNNNADNCDINTESFAEAGLISTDSIRTVQALCHHGEHAAANTKSGALLIVSNPTQDSEDTFTVGLDAGAHGSEVGNWRTARGTVLYNPAIDLSTRPVLRVGRRTSSTDQVCISGLALMITWVPDLAVSSSFEASGGFVAGGDVDYFKGKVYEGIGGFVTGGSSDFFKGCVYSADGGFIISGGVNYSFGYLYVGSGGFVIGGVSPPSFGRALVSNGGFVLGGASPTSSIEMTGDTFNFYSRAMTRKNFYSTMTKELEFHSDVVNSIRFVQRATEE